MRFSQRIGKKPTMKEIQLESMDTELKNGLWNVIKMSCLDSLGLHPSPYISDYQSFSENLWHNFYKLPVDEIPKNAFDREYYIRRRFFNNEWYEVYDFIEFILGFELMQQVDLIGSQMVYPPSSA